MNNFVPPSRSVATFPSSLMNPPAPPPPMPASLPLPPRPAAPTGSQATHVAAGSLAHGVVHQNPLQPPCPHQHLEGVVVHQIPTAVQRHGHVPVPAFTPEWRDRLFQAYNVPCSVCQSNIKSC